MVLPVGTVSELRSKSARSVDPRHCRPKLFRGGTDSDCDGNSIYHCNREGDRDRHRNANCDADCDRNKRSICDCNRDRHCDRDRRRGDCDGDARGRI